MSTSLTGLTTNFFPSAQNGFTTTLASTIASGATTVPLNSVAGYSNGQIAVFVVDPSNATQKQTFTGVIDTAGIQVTSVVWTAGTNQQHTAGATVVDYATATHMSMTTKGISIAHDQGGVHKSGASYPSPAISGTVTGGATYNTPILATPSMTTRFDGWVTGLPTPNTITYNGNNNYSLVFNSTDLTGYISNGHRLRLTRTVTAPTQSTSLNGTTQYYSKTSPAGMTFTNNFVVSAWVKMTGYAADQCIASRYDGTSGWIFATTSTGQVYLRGVNAGGGNNKQITSYASIPLNKWVHITAQLDMTSSTNSPTVNYVMFDGLDVLATQSSAGTNPTALIQSGNLQVGAFNGANGNFPGKIAQVAIYSAKITQATITASIPQTLVGTETSLVSAYSFNNSINDLNANANNLTAQGSAVATNADSPFAGGANASTAYTAGTTEFGEVFNISFSTNTTIVAQVPEGYVIPTTGGVNAAAYSTGFRPLGWQPLGDIINASYVMSGQSITTQAQVGGLSSTVYVSAGRKVRIRAAIPVASIGTASQGVTLAIWDGAVGTTQLSDYEVFMPSNGTGNMVLTEAIVYPSSAGSKTYNISAAASSGTLSTNATITRVAYISVELV